MEYRIFQIIYEEVCVPSQDFCATSTDWDKKYIQTLTTISEGFSSEEEAIKDLENSSYGSGEFVILPFIKK